MKRVLFTTCPSAAGTLKFARVAHRIFPVTHRLVTGHVPPAALLEGRDDFLRHAPIHRWWGGTLLSRGHVWRWDAARGQLVPPPAGPVA